MSRQGDPPAQLVRDLSGALDLEIAEVQEYMRPRLAFPDGRALSLRTDDARLIVDACRPEREPDGWYFTPRNGETFPQITVSLLRPVEQIVKEIRRRLLPDYAAVWRAYETAVAEHRTYVRNVFLLRERTRAALGARWDQRDKTRDQANRAEQPTVNLTFTNELYGDVRISGDGARIELNVTGRDLVVAIAEFIGSLPTTKKES